MNDTPPPNHPKPRFNIYGVMIRVKMWDFSADAIYETWWFCDLDVFAIEDYIFTTMCVCVCVHIFVYIYIYVCLTSNWIYMLASIWQPNSTRSSRVGGVCACCAHGGWLIVLMRCRHRFSRLVEHFAVDFEMKFDSIFVFGCDWIPCSFTHIYIYIYRLVFVSSSSSTISNSVPSIHGEWVWTRVS